MRRRSRSRTACSAFRLSSAMLSKLKKIERSARSGRMTMSSMPFKITGRVASNSVSSMSLYNDRVAKPPPVANRHSVSEIQSGRLETLSNANKCPLFAAMNRSRSSRGRARNGALLGSITLRRIAVKVDFAVPCSPATQRTG